MSEVGELHKLADALWEISEGSGTPPRLADMGEADYWAGMILTSFWGEQQSRLVSENAALRERVEALEADVTDRVVTAERVRGLLDVAVARTEALTQERDRLREALDLVLPYFNGTEHPGTLDDQVRAALAAHEPQGGSADARPLHLVWRGHGLEDEWVDERCGCAYHPDDQNGTHNGAPHVHLCAKHQDTEHAAHEPQEPSS